MLIERIVMERQGRTLFRSITLRWFSLVPPVLLLASLFLAIRRCCSCLANFWPTILVIYCRRRRVKS